MSEQLVSDIAELKKAIAAIPEPSQVDQVGASWWSVQNAMTISAATLLFGVLALIIVAWLMRKERDSDAKLRALGTILIVFAALFLVVAGYSDNQVAPAFGLLGTIAGYLFGKSGSATMKAPSDSA